MNPDAGPREVEPLIEELEAILGCRLRTIYRRT
jgi:hypothetical protein